MLQTRFCERFGVATPIVVAPMGPDLTGPELVAAVSNAEGFGILVDLCHEVAIDLSQGWSPAGVSIRRTPPWEIML